MRTSGRGRGALRDGERQVQHVPRAAGVRRHMSPGPRTGHRGDRHRHDDAAERTRDSHRPARQPSRRRVEGGAAPARRELRAHGSRAVASVGAEGLSSIERPSSKAATACFAKAVVKTRTVVAHAGEHVRSQQARHWTREQQLGAGGRRPRRPRAVAASPTTVSQGTAARSRAARAGDRLVVGDEGGDVHGRSISSSISWAPRSRRVAVKPAPGEVASQPRAPLVKRLDLPRAAQARAALAATCRPSPRRRCRSPRREHAAVEASADGSAWAHGRRRAVAHGVLHQRLQRERGSRASRAASSIAPAGEPVAEAQPLDGQ